MAEYLQEILPYFIRRWSILQKENSDHFAYSLSATSIPWNHSSSICYGRHNWQKGLNIDPKSAEIGPERARNILKRAEINAVEQKCACFSVK